MKSLKIIIPGLLVAATGVGAGDLASSAFAGSILGTSVLWAVIFGAFFKYFITEGMARYQLATGNTFLEGASLHFGKAVQIVFLIYLLTWTLVVGAAMMSATGIAAHALLPVFRSAETGKIVFGILHSIAGYLIVRRGGFALFEKIMASLIVLMFASTIYNAVLSGPEIAGILKGMLVPVIPQKIDTAGINQGSVWTLAIIGGVGGTLTILSYGYWIREEGRDNTSFIRITRFDLLTGYFMTALFSICMIIIASGMKIPESGSATLLVRLAGELTRVSGPAGSMLFLIGAWAAVFSSLLGVWQSVPYIFADFYNLFLKKGRISGGKLTGSLPYRYYLLFIAFIPIAGLFFKFILIQKVYAVFGSLIVAFFGIGVLLLTGSVKYISQDSRSSYFSSALMIIAVVFYFYIGVPEFIASLGNIFR
ncbi:MAG: Nramp family divalent metal transporter [Ignavibacteriales bacterium]|nr:Nramp family divalent metal transporter [Melioribacteraceae bacterium]MCF8316637.1 Nramp family divalent metal transporter [Ignavibacteriales bacterium]MCF8438243.1 Nramp family divalent metal transporter [Ignavibacteriales bacterium]